MVFSIVVVCALLLLWGPRQILIARRVADPKPPGGIQLPYGYRHQYTQGIDSLTGRIWRPGRPEINYDIGVWAGEQAIDIKPEEREWSREQTINGLRVVTVLMKTNDLIVTFMSDHTRNLAAANFSAFVKSQDDIDEVMSVLKTYGSTFPPSIVPATSPL